jgi:hypothetical protein
MNVEGIANAQATILRPPPCPKSRKLNPNVEMLFHLKASGDNVCVGGLIQIVDNTTQYIWDW